MKDETPLFQFVFLLLSIAFFCLLAWIFPGTIEINRLAQWGGLLFWPVVGIVFAIAWALDKVRKAKP